jgi:hypothetical protein
MTYPLTGRGRRRRPRPLAPPRPGPDLLTAQVVADSRQLLG